MDASLRVMQGPCSQLLCWRRLQPAADTPPPLLARGQAPRVRARLARPAPGVPGRLQASCTAAVKASIVSCLSLRDPLLLQSSFNRPNIAYSVK